MLTALTGIVTPLLVCASSDPKCLDMTSIFLPRVWKKTPVFVTDDLTVDPLGPSGQGIEMTFEVPKFCHFILDQAIMSLKPPVTVTSNPPGAAPYYVDHLGFADIAEFKINFGSNLVYTRTSYDLCFDFRTRYTQEKQFNINYLVRGDLSTAQRNADLVNGVTTVTDTAMPFSDLCSQCLPIVCMSQKIRFTYRSKPLNSIVANLNQIPGTTVAFANGAVPTYQMWLRVAHVTGNEAALVLAQSRAPDGVSYLISQNVRQESDDVQTSTNSTQNIRLGGITKPIKVLQWALVPRNLVNDTGYNDFFFFRADPMPAPPFGPTPPGMNPYKPILQWGITANGNIVQRTIVRDWNRMWQWYHKHESIGGDEIHEQNYAEYPHAVNANTGFMDYTNLNNPVLSISFDVGGTGIDPLLGPPNVQVLRLIVNARDHNWWVIHAGNWIRSLN